MTVNYPSLNWALKNTWEITDKIFPLPEIFDEKRLIITAEATPIDTRLTIAGDLRVWSEFPSLSNAPVSVGSLLVPIDELALTKPFDFGNNQYRLTFNRASGIIGSVTLKIWKPTNMPLVDLNPASIYAPVTSFTETASITIVSAATQILTANVERKGLRIKNTGSSPLYVGFANTLTVANAFQVIPANSAYEFGLNYVGAVFGICTSNKSTTAIATEAL